MSAFEEPDSSLEKQLDDLIKKAEQEIEKSDNPSALSSPAESLKRYIETNRLFLQTPSTPEETEKDRAAKSLAATAILVGWGVKPTTAQQIVDILKKIKQDRVTIH